MSLFSVHVHIPRESTIQRKNASRAGEIDIRPRGSCQFVTAIHASVFVIIAAKVTADSGFRNSGAALPFYHGTISPRADYPPLNVVSVITGLAYLLQ